jgi:hypothetical protein
MGQACSNAELREDLTQAEGVVTIATLQPAERYAIATLRIFVGIDRVSRYMGDWTVVSGTQKTSDTTHYHAVGMV